MYRGFLCIAWCVCLCLTMMFGVSAQDGTITAITFSNSNAVAEENLSVSGYGDKDSGYATSTVGGRLYASVSGTDFRKLEWSKGEYAEAGMQPVMTGGTKNPWGHGAYLEIRVSTVGYENITFSASLGATKKGPRDYKLQYSTDGVTYTDVAGVFYTVTVNKTMLKAFDGVPLPTAVNNTATVYIRIAIASNMMVNGTAGLIGSTGGETAINNIVVSGTPIATTTQPPVTTTAVSEIPSQADPAVPSANTTVSLAVTNNATVPTDPLVGIQSTVPSQTVTEEISQTNVSQESAPTSQTAASSQGESTTALSASESVQTTASQQEIPRSTVVPSVSQQTEIPKETSLGTAEPSPKTPVTVISSVVTGDNTQGVTTAVAAVLAALCVCAAAKKHCLTK